MDKYYKCIIACIICIIIICIIIIIDIEINIIDPNTITILCGIVITLGSGIVYSIYKKDKEENRDIYANIIDPKTYSIKIEGNNEVNDIDSMKRNVGYYNNRLHYMEGIYNLIKEELKYKDSDKDISITDKLFNLFQSDDTIIKRIKLNNIFNLTKDALITTGYVDIFNYNAKKDYDSRYNYYKYSPGNDPYSKNINDIIGEPPKELVLYRHYEDDELNNMITQINEKYPIRNIKYVNNADTSNEDLYELKKKLTIQKELESRIITSLVYIFNKVYKESYIGKENKIIENINNNIQSTDVTINDLINAYILKH